LRNTRAPWAYRTRVRAVCIVHETIGLGAYMHAYIVIAIATLTASSAAAQPVGDAKLWLSGKGVADLSKAIDVSGSLELRSGADTGFDQLRLGLALGMRPNKYLGFNVFYVLMSRDGDRQVGTVDETRHRIGADASVRYETDRLSLGNRVRLQDTTYELDANHVHLRDKLHAGYEAVKHVTPYVALEFIYLLSPHSEYRETRFYLGVDWRASKRLELGAYYLLQEETNVRLPEHNQVLGLELTYRFHPIKKKSKLEPADHD
jgi:hypothetical protein